MKRLIFTLLFIFSAPAISENNGSSLYQAILNNELNIVQEHLHQGINPNSKFPSGWSLLYGATIMGSTEVADLLITKGAKPSKKELEAAIGNKHTKILELILESGANPNYYTEEGVTPLMLAANLGSSEIINILLKHDANKQSKSKNGETALDIAKKRREEYTNAINTLK